MAFFAPKLPDYEIEAWARLPLAERVRAVCAAWTVDGYGAPLGIYAAYGLKIAAYVAGWLAVCTLPSDLALSEIATWWASPEAFTKAIGWTLLFEGLGLGCGSGPLTGRYLPPVGGALWFATPGTTKLPLYPDLPWLGGTRRSPLDVALYLAAIGVLCAVLLSPGLPHPALLIAVVVLLPLLGLADRTVFLAFRSEHYLSVVICLLFTDWIAGSKVVWLGIWLWAATSKLNHHFPAVVGVMTSNAPWTRGTPLRRWMVVDWPSDLRPSRAAGVLAHFGTVFEVVVPLMLVFSAGGPLTLAALVGITAFHAFILSNVPMGVPLEWNVIMVYGAWVLFGVHADVAIGSIGHPVLIAWLVGFHLALPLYGSLFPERVSFLLAMRYYAGNWAYNVWLFRDDAAVDKLIRGVHTWSPRPEAQLAPFYDRPTITALLSKVIAFRFMHLQGRALRHLLPRAAPDVDRRVWLDGEMVAGIVLGWNFGEGHLSHHELLAAVQAQCDFAEGELRCIFVESQPIHRQELAWRIHDAATGQIAAGTLPVARLLQGQPWQIEDGARPTG